MTRPSQLALVSILLLLASCTSDVKVSSLPNLEDVDIPEEDIRELRALYDSDGDGLTDDIDPCPATPLNDADGDGVCEVILSDLNGDGCVDDEDQSILLGEYGTSGDDLRADIIPDGTVNLTDFAVFGQELGQCRDNCPEDANENQSDSDKNGVGDVCEESILECESNFCTARSVGHYCDENESIYCVEDSESCMVESGRTPCLDGCDVGGVNDGLCSAPPSNPNDPSISETSGTRADGTTLTISGSDFGTHPRLDEVWFLGGKDGWIENTANGTRPNQAPSTKYIYGSNGLQDEVTTNDAWSGSKSINLRNDPARLGYHASTWAYKNPNTFRKVFISFWYRMDVEYMPSNTPQHKFVTVTSDTYAGCAPNVDPLRSNNGSLYWNYRLNGLTSYDMVTTMGNYTLLGCGIVPDTFEQAEAIGYSKSSDSYFWDRLTRGQSGGSSAHQYNIDHGIWNRVDIYMDHGTWDNYDGYMKVKVVKPTGTYAGQQVGMEYEKVLLLSNRGTCLRCYPAAERDSFVWYNLFHDTGGGVPPVSNHFVDDPYIQVGTRARVELGNQPSYDNANKLEIQRPTSWSANQIQVEVNHGGSFSSGDRAYLFVIRDDGRVSSGKAITIP